MLFFDVAPFSSLYRGITNYQSVWDGMELAWEGKESNSASHFF